MQRIILIIVGLMGLTNSFAYDQFKVEVKGCGAESYKQAVELIEAQDFIERVGSFHTCLHTGFAYKTRTDITFKEVYSKEFDIFKSYCVLKASTEYYCERMSW